MTDAPAFFWSRSVMAFRRRQFLQVASVAALASTLPRLAAALDYPTRPVHLVVGFAGGTGPDITARLIGQFVSERLGQSIIIDNRPGAGTNIATESVVRSPADGYTLLMITSTNSYNVTLYKNLSFDFIRDIAPVASIGIFPFLMVVNPSVPAKTVGEFIAYAKANPGKINMASAGIGSAPHVFGELFKMMAGVDLLHVPYRGDYWADLIAGRTQVAFAPVTTAIGYARSGKVRALAVTTTAPLQVWPDLPTVAGTVPGFEAVGWLGIGAPRGTPVEIVEKLNAAVTAGLADAKIKSRLAELGAVSMPMTPGELGEFIAAETQKWAKVIKFANITAQ
jgi:tripartite-type tricarboxylate transporter receptor subunit TctC